MENKIKITFFHDAKPWGDKIGSISTYIAHRAMILSKSRFEVYWTDGLNVAYFNYSKNTWELLKEFKINKVLYKVIKRYLHLLPGIKFLIKKYKIDIVEVNDSLRYNIKYLKKKVKVILYVRTSIPIRNLLNNINGGLHTLLNYYGIRKNLINADKIIACSNEISLYTAGFYRINIELFTTVPHSYSIDLINKEDIKNLNVDNSYLFIGNYEYVKGIDLLFNAFIEYKKRGGKNKLKIVGPKDIYDTPKVMLKAWGKFYSKNKISVLDNNEVIFIPYLNKNELYKLCLTARAIIVPSRFESFSAVTAESVLLNCPLIVSEFVGIKDLLLKFNSAYLFNPYEIEDFIKALFEFEDEKVRSFYSSNTISLKEYLTGNYLINKTIDFYKHIVNEE